MTSTDQTVMGPTHFQALVFISGFFVMAYYKVNPCLRLSEEKMEVYFTVAFDWTQFS